MAYVDGFVIPLPKKNIAAYHKMAAPAGKVWMEHGALEYVEAVADDVQPGKLTSFPQAVKLKPDEVVVFSWIRYRYMDTPFLHAAAQIALGGALVFLTGIMIGSA